MPRYSLFNYLANFSMNNAEVHILKSENVFLNLLDTLLTSRNCPKWDIFLKLELNTVNPFKNYFRVKYSVLPKSSIPENSITDMFLKHAKLIFKLN